MYNIPRNFNTSVNIIIAAKVSVMANGSVETLSVLESKILNLGKDQCNNGYHGGTFTPGYIRKETGLSYLAINPALLALVNYGFLEASKSTAFRNGSTIDIDVYTITYKGLQATEEIRLGAIKVEEHEFSNGLHRRNEPMNSFRPRRESGHGPELIQSFKSMETDLATISEKVKELHTKFDRILASSVKPETTNSSERPKARKPRAASRKSLKHQTIILDSLKALSEKSKFVLANNVYETYSQKCKDLGISSRNTSQYRNILKRLEKENHVSLKRVGCKELRIKGRGSRVVVELTQDGSELLKKNEGVGAELVRWNIT